MTGFKQKLEEKIRQIAPERLVYEDNEFIRDEFTRIDEYAEKHGYINTALALRVSRALHSGMTRGRAVRSDGTRVKKPYFCHCMAVCRMLIDLPTGIKGEEEDIMLAAALCHDVPAFVAETRHTDALSRIYGMDPAVSELIDLIYTRDCETDADFEILFACVLESKAGLLIKLADRGHVVEGLYNVSVWRANEYIFETRTRYIPLCIDARERYPELDRALGVLQAKLHDLIVATEIFLKRYTDLEREMMEEIIQLQEDNARLRTMIRAAGGKA